MAHKTLIGGTAYEISGGRAKVNGTAYSIDKGKTLVGGTAYEVGFGVPCTVRFIGQATLIGNTYPSTPYAMMNGTKYTPDGTTKEVIVPSGTTIDVYSMANMMGSTKLIINGATIIEYGKQSMGVQKEINYTYTVQGNVEIILKFDNYNTEINITEIPEGSALITLKGDFAWSGVRYNGVYYSSPTTFIANVGDVIFVESYGYTDSPIYLNDKLVANEPSETEYYYTVVSNAVISATAGGEMYNSYSSVYITDANA